MFLTKHVRICIGGHGTLSLKYLDLKYKLRKFDKVPVVSFVRYTVVTVQAMAFFVVLSCIED